jgi:hypothetical protein
MREDLVKGDLEGVELGRIGVGSSDNVNAVVV